MFGARFPEKDVPSTSHSQKFRGLLVRSLIGALLLAGITQTSLAADWDVIGGDDVFPVNPGLSISAMSSILSGGQLEGFAPQVTPQAQLGAALSSSLSAANRPSVLTPYAGILKGEGEDAVYDSFGNLMTNKASTIGRGKIGLGLSYQHSDFEKYDGEGIGRLAQTDLSERIPPVGQQTFEVGGLDILGSYNYTLGIRADNVEFKADVVTLSLTYGLLENLDVGALVPYIWLNTQGEIEITLNETFTSVSGSVTTQDRDEDAWDRDFEGPGDIILFTKYQILSQFGLPERIKGPMDLSLQGEVKLATGDDAKFLGTGNTDAALRMLLQRRIAEWLRLRGEVGYNYSGLGSEFSSFDYKLGGEVQLMDNLTASAELIGSYSRAFEGMIDMASGVKYGLTRDFKVYAGGRFPLNDNGLRSDFSPILGIEYTYTPAPELSMEELEIPEFEEGAASES